jgi:hypothetical protein
MASATFTRSFGVAIACAGLSPCCWLGGKGQEPVFVSVGRQHAPHIGAALKVRLRGVSLIHLEFPMGEGGDSGHAGAVVEAAEVAMVMGHVIVGSSRRASGPGTVRR